MWFNELPTDKELIDLIAARYKIAKWFAVGWFMWCGINLYLNAKATRAWYHKNWCGEMPVGECSYWVGSTWDYMFLTSSSFHDGFALGHVGLIGAILLFIITMQMQTLSELRLSYISWYQKHK